MTLELPGRDIWLKTTDKDGKSSISHHRLWDVDLFMTARQKEAVKEGARSSKF